MAVAPGIFRQYDVRGIVGRDLTIDAAYEIGRGYAAFLSERGIVGAVAIGRDNRPSGTLLHKALTGGLRSCGVDIVDLGVVPTPILYWALHNVGVVGGIQITGSHNPPEYNGFKLCVGTTSIHGSGIQRLHRLIMDGVFPAGDGGTVAEDVVDRYVADIAKRIGPLARPLTAVVDCGNGSGALVARRLFEALGIGYHGLFDVSDGTFPNHHPDPTVEDNLSDLIAEVGRRGADVGIAFDGDADRIGVIDERGNIVWGDHILIVYARDVLARTGPGHSIIFDVKCSQALPDAISAAGGRPVMWKTGHSLIKEKMKELGAPLAGEMSGHMFFNEGFYGHDDALYGAARFLSILARSRTTVSGMLADVPRFVVTPELRIDVTDETKFAIVDRAIAHFRKSHDVIDVDGARVLFGDGWGLIRASNTQPVLVARYEALTADRLSEIRGLMESWLREQGVSV
ncbi:MAG: phosphomannomutase/phosphoglucomutase [Gemmatimonadaceae bacterium]